MESNPGYLFKSFLLYCEVSTKAYRGYTTETFLLGLQSSRIEFHSFEGIKVNTFSITRTDQSEYFCEQAEELLTYYIVQRMSFVEMTYLQIGDYKIHKKTGNCITKFLKAFLINEV